MATLFTGFWFKSGSSLLRLLAPIKFSLRKKNNYFSSVYYCGLSHNIVMILR
jgi:hypothetical protein